MTEQITCRNSQGSTRVYDIINSWQGLTARSKTAVR